MLRLRRRVLDGLPAPTRSSSTPAIRCPGTTGQTIVQGTPSCTSPATRSNVNLGFFDGASIAYTHRVLSGAGGRMRHLKCRSLEEVRAAWVDDHIRRHPAINRIRGDRTLPTPSRDDATMTVTFCGAAPSL